jgi:hypothetical protein
VDASWWLCYGPYALSVLEYYADRRTVRRLDKAFVYKGGYYAADEGGSEAEERSYSVDDPDDREELSNSIESTKASILRARSELRSFMVSNFAIQDVI